MAANIRLPFEMPDTPEKVWANCQALYEFITNVEAQTEAFKNIKVADGTTVKLTTNTVGDVTKPSNPSFRGHNSATQALASNTVAEININTEDSDAGSNFDPSTHRFTAPVAGTYALTFGGTIATGSGAGRLVMELWLNFAAGGSSLGLVSLPLGNVAETYGFCVTAYSVLAAGDTVSAAYFLSIGAIGSGTLQTNSYFTGTLVN